MEEADLAAQLFGVESPIPRPEGRTSEFGAGRVYFLKKLLKHSGGDWRGGRGGRGGGLRKAGKAPGNRRRGEVGLPVSMVPDAFPGSWGRRSPQGTLHGLKGWPWRLCGGLRTPWAGGKGHGLYLRPQAPAPSLRIHAWPALGQGARAFPSCRRRGNTCRNPPGVRRRPVHRRR